MKEYLIYIYSNNTKLFWKNERKGYTTEIADAGLYTEKEAVSIENNNRGDIKIHIIEYALELGEIYRGARRKLESIKRFKKRSGIAQR